MGSLHSEAPSLQPAEGTPPTGVTSPDDNPAGSGAESINQKCRILSEKLDQLLSTLHEEATPTGQDQTISPDDGSDPSLQEV